MAKSHTASIRNATYGINDGVDVKDTGQLSTMSKATPKETNETVQIRSSNPPKGDLGGWNTNK